MDETERKYEHEEIESKWRKKWEADSPYTTKEDSKKEKCYVLDMFPYPSGEGLHVGHPKGYIATDIYSRMKRMQGFNVLHPMGWDAFGLPAENYAIKNKIHPRVAVEKNIARYKEQLSILGFDYDWSREINTTRPEYYKWTQWIFLKMFEHGLAFESNEPINWCPVCMTGLANEDLDGDKCERCGTVVVKKPMRQWKLRITDYADRMLEDLDGLDWPTSIKESQKNWIGRSEGMLFSAKVKDTDITIKTFSAHFEAFKADTFVVIASDHPLLPKLVSGLPNEKEILTYARELTAKRALQGFEETEGEGMFTGRYIIDPVGNGDLPIWIASFALADYGTGIVKCSAHDERDFKFAKKYGIKLKPVMFPAERDKADKVRSLETCFTDTKTGVLVEPREFDGKIAGEVRTEIIKHLLDNNLAKKQTTYRLKDWVFSRQRYWGEPIPLIHCENCRKLKASSIIVHGIGEIGNKWEGKDNTMHWIPWLRDELEKRGVQTTAPQMPRPYAPIYSEWKAEFEKYEVNSESILVGHSAGGAFLTRWLIETKTKINKLILVSPAKIVPTATDASPDVIKAKTEFYGFDLEKVNARQVSLFYSTDDEQRVVDAASMYVDALNPKISKFADRGHFTYEDMGRVEFPELLKEVQIGINLNPGVIAVPEAELPVRLPEVDHYEPTGTGESPLANIAEWVNTKCPDCGGPARRETNTMPQWAGSSWYHLAYACKSEDGFSLEDKGMVNHWQPVDFYVGGAEHATRHLIYARFWHKFLYDIGVVTVDEPFKKLQNVGLIQASDGRKMSKRFGNVVNPDEMVRLYGADTFRMYEMFLGPFEQSVGWNTDGMMGPRRFVERLWKLSTQLKEESSEVTKQALHVAIRDVTNDISAFRHNTAVSSLMKCMNVVSSEGISEPDYKILLQIIAPIAPHVTEELWHVLGEDTSVHESEWPTALPQYLQVSETTIAVQVNGKLRGTVNVEVDASQESVDDLVRKNDKINTWLEDKGIKKVIFVSNKIINYILE